MLPALRAVLRDVRAHRRHRLRRQQPGLAEEGRLDAERPVRERGDELRRAQGVEDPHRPLRDDRSRPLPGLARRPRARQHPGDRRLRADHRRRQRPDEPARPLARQRDDQHPHRELHRRHRLPLRLLRRRRLRGRRAGQLLDLRPHRPGPPGRGRQRPRDARHPAVPLGRRRLGRPQVERRRRGLRARTPAPAGRTSTTSTTRCTPARSPTPAPPATRRARARSTTTTTSSTTTATAPTPRAFRAERAAVAGQRQRPARHRGGLRGPRLLDGRLVPDVAREAPRRLGRVDRAAGEGGARRPRHLPGARSGRSAPRTGSTTTRAASRRSASTAAAPS